MPGTNVNSALDAGGTPSSPRCFEFRRDVARLACPGFSAAVSDVFTRSSFDAPGALFPNQR
jgi:hypothetical protein